LEELPKIIEEGIKGELWRLESFSFWLGSHPKYCQQPSLDDIKKKPEDALNTSSFTTTSFCDVKIISPQYLTRGIFPVFLLLLSPRREFL